MKIQNDPRNSKVIPKCNPPGGGAIMGSVVSDKEGSVMSTIFLHNVTSDCHARIFMGGDCHARIFMGRPMGHFFYGGDEPLPSHRLPGSYT